MAIIGVSGDPARRPTVRHRGRARAGRWRELQPLVLDGHVADAFLDRGAMAADEAALYLLRGRRGGVTRDTRTLVDGRRVATVRLEDVAVEPGARLRGRADAREAMLDVGRAVVSAALCGVAEEAFARTMGYLKERKQFDRRIGSFQALAASRRAHACRHRECVVGESQGDGGARRATPIRPRFDVAVAKAKASETACTATAECLQMHGGIGMTDEFDIGLYLKRARVDSVLFGDAAFHADRVATMLGY